MIDARMMKVPMYPVPGEVTDTNICFSKEVIEQAFNEALDRDPEGLKLNIVDICEKSTPIGTVKGADFEKGEISVLLDGEVEVPVQKLVDEGFRASVNIAGTAHDDPNGIAHLDMGAILHSFHLLLTA